MCKCECKWFWKYAHVYTVVHVLSECVFTYYMKVSGPLTNVILSLKQTSLQASYIILSRPFTLKEYLLCVTKRNSILHYQLHFHLK